MKFYEALAQAQKGGRILSTKNTNKVWVVDNDRLLETYFNKELDEADNTSWHLAKTPSAQQLNEPDYVVVRFFNSFNKWVYKCAIASAIKLELQKALAAVELIEKENLLVTLKQLNAIRHFVSDADALAGNGVVLLGNAREYKPVSLLIEEGKAFNKAMKKSLDTKG